MEYCAVQVCPWPEASCPRWTISLASSGCRSTAAPTMWEVTFTLRRSNISSSRGSPSLNPYSYHLVVGKSDTWNQSSALDFQRRSVVERRLPSAWRPRSPCARRSAKSFRRPLSPVRPKVASGCHQEDALREQQQRLRLPG